MSFSVLLLSNSNKGLCLTKACHCIVARDVAKLDSKQSQSSVDWGLGGPLVAPEALSSSLFCMQADPGLVQRQ